MASDFLLEIDTIPGESQDKKHKNTIEIDSFSWGGSNPGTFQTGGGGGKGKTNFSDITFSAKVSKASPLLAQAMVEHKHFKNVKLYVRKRGGQGVVEDYYKVELEQAAVTAYSSSGHGTDAEHVETETFSIGFAKIKFVYKEQDEKGGFKPAIEFLYDLKAGA